MKYVRKVSDDDTIFISLPSKPEPFSVGPGTVPLSGTSVSTVSMKELRKTAEEVSKLGIYDTDKQQKTSE